MVTRRPGLTYLGGSRFGAWLFRGLCEQHQVRCSGVTRGTRFVEVSVLGRSAGVCW